MKRLANAAIALYPAGFVAAYVLLSFSATPTPLLGLWRPLIVGVALAVALQLVVLLILRSRHRAALVTSVLVMIMAAAWLLVAVLATIAAWWVIVNLLRRRTGRAPLRLAEERISSTLAAFATAFAIVASFGVVAAVPALAPTALEPSGADAIPDAPDIIVLLLDGYPRADALLEQLGHDNTRFLQALEDREFTVADDSRSNYTATWATIASMLHMRFVDEIEELLPLPNDPAEQYRVLMSAINRGPAIAELSGRGYEIVAVPSPFESAALVTADRYRSDGHLTSFELSLVQHSVAGKALLAIVPDLFFDEHRRRILAGFTAVGEEVERSRSGPAFVFAHLLTPHAPTVFEADGTAAPPVACFPGCSPWAFTEREQWNAFPAQVEHVNDLILATVDRIAAAAPDAVIVLMSDHGSHVPGYSQANLLRTLFATRTPAHPASVTDAAPVNLFPQVFNAYFDADLELRPYRSWISESEAPLTMQQVTLEEVQ